MLSPVVCCSGEALGCRLIPWVLYGTKVHQVGFHLIHTFRPCTLILLNAQLPRDLIDPLCEHRLWSTGSVGFTIASRGYDVFAPSMRYTNLQDQFLELWITAACIDYTPHANTSSSIHACNTHTTKLHIRSSSPSTSKGRAYWLPRRLILHRKLPCNSASPWLTCMHYGPHPSGLQA